MNPRIPYGERDRWRRACRIIGGLLLGFAIGMGHPDIDGYVAFFGALFLSLSFLI